MPHPLLSKTKSLLAELVSFNTAPSLSNRSLVQWVDSYLVENGLSATTKSDDSGEKITLLSTIGPSCDGGIVLSGHTDVVDALSQKWQRSPFDLTEEDGKWYARGSCDMKGFIACLLAQAPTFAAADIKRPIHIALSRDEEIGSVGMPDMLALIRQSGLSPAAAIVGEPTKMQIVAGHKAGHEMHTIFTGVPAHSAIPDSGCSAVVPAAQFITYLKDLGDQMARSPVADSLFNPAYAVINIGIVRGGTAHNIVPGRCEVAWHYRPLPGEDGAAVIKKIIDYTENELLPTMLDSGHPASVETVTDAAYPGLLPQPDSPALRLVQQLQDRDDYTVVPFGADSGFFQQGGIPAVLIGPGDIAQAHKPDEFVEIAEIERCLYFLDRLCHHLSETIG